LLWGRNDHRTTTNILVEVMSRRWLKTQFVNNRALRILLQNIGKRRPRVFVYHRFSAPGQRLHGRISADEFGWQLDKMSRHGEVMTLASFFEHYLHSGHWPRNAIVITIDDGHRDFYQWAYPELKKRSLSATLFPVVDFIDRSLWLWPDRLDYALRGQESASLTVAVDGHGLDLSYTNEEERRTVWNTLSDLCVSSPDDVRNTIVESVIEQIGLEIPSTPTPDYEACTWNEIAAMAENGIEIGCHSKSHPILSKLPIDELDSEIAGAKEILERKLGRKVVSFCYPNGMPADISPAVVESVANAGFLGAVVVRSSSDWTRYGVSRMAVGHDRVDFFWKLYAPV